MKNYRFFKTLIKIFRSVKTRIAIFFKIFQPNKIAYFLFFV